MRDSSKRVNNILFIYEGPLTAGPFTLCPSASRVPQDVVTSIDPGRREKWARKAKFN